ncbi:MAG TPA: NAD(P)H-dependent glycerol-3-phosphate dehydrogenase [Gammaproteobacteria bacterium]|nr:NAD(P)H-dependent glycerol-3-phosphate dehydrogenase [Gammaproteobacteria bacterium]
MPATITVLGAGAWGSALAVHLARSGQAVRLWAHRAEQAAELAGARENCRRLPGVPFPDSLVVKGDFPAALAGADYALVAVPSQAFAQTLVGLSASILPVFWATKGLDPASGRPLHEKAREILGAERGLGVLSGPSFAAEVARGLPTAVTVAATDGRLARRFAALLHGPSFRAYVSTDLTGVELGGAAKNVIAIAAGISDGLGFGANARAGLITRGLAEILRLGRALGARSRTLTGLSGLGDLVLTATDDQSRNRRFGLALGRGTNAAAAEAEIGAAIEGIPTARALTRLARELGVEMPIGEEIRAILDGARSPRAAVEALMSRRMKSER